jgi:hypothetical protein
VFNCSCTYFLTKKAFILLLSLQCITTEQPPKNPCARCAKRNLRCEYFQAPDQSPDISESEFPPASSSVMPRYSLPSQPESWPSTSPLPSSFTLPHSWNPPLPHRNLSSNRERGGTLPLPYTGPPPRNRIPRYTGTHYPDLTSSNPPASMPMSTQQMPGHFPYYPSAQPHRDPGAHLAQSRYNLYNNTAQYLPIRPDPSNALHPVPHPHTLTHAPLPLPCLSDTNMTAPLPGNTFDWPESGGPSARCVCVIIPTSPILMLL